MAGTTPSPKNKKMHRKRGAAKPKMTKEDRRAKYTQLARDREGARRRKLISTNLVCYQCRQRGHAVADCPSTDKKKKQSTGGGRICYKCGSTEHPLSKCPKRNEGNADDLPFCHCFVCNEMGHLSSKCPKNEHGIYVKGGECKNCGSKQHLSSDCPQREQQDQQKKEKFVSGEAEIDASTLLQGEGDELVGMQKEKTKQNDNGEESDKKKRKKKRRVVNF